MKRNKVVSKKMSVVTGVTVRFAAILVTLFVMVILHLLASSSCQHLHKTIGEKEKQLVRLEDERARESARWEEMKTTEQLERMLAKHGLKMRYSKPDQVVRMMPNGLPQAGQRSVAKSRGRVLNTAQNVSYRRRR